MSSLQENSKKYKMTFAVAKMYHFQPICISSFVQAEHEACANAAGWTWKLEICCVSVTENENNVYCRTISGSTCCMN